MAIWSRLRRFKLILERFERFVMLKEIIDGLLRGVSPEDIAEELGVSLEKVLKIQNKLKNA